MNFFILPGNPPATHFYELWADEIRERHPDTRIEIAHYPLMESCADSDSYFQGLRDKVQSQFLRFCLREDAVASLVGHSLGGYLALKVLEKIPDKVERCYLLHPFLRQPMIQGRLILKLAHELRRFSRLEDWLLRARPLVGLLLPEANSLTAEQIHVFTQLAYHEHLTIAQDLSPSELAPVLRDKLRVYSTKGDIWCPPVTVSSLGGDIRHTCGPASHNFIVKRRERDLLYEFLYERQK